MTEILLGFEVPSGKPVFIPLHHLVITGMTKLSGKTTTIEALIQRSGLRAIVFKTKRGEKGFERVGQLLPLYFTERSDWQYVSSLIEATLREKMKFERSWIIRACKGAKTLRDVYTRVKEFLKKERLRSLDRSIFTNLQAYLELVLPSIEKLDFTDKLDIGPGVNVMDLEDLYAKPEVQALIIRSVMEYILEYESNIIVVVPECWKFLPQGRGSPVKIFFERFIREGATINNYLWLDSQDIAGVDKTPLRQVDNWILGRQRETHEVERTIDAIPLPKAEKPKPLQIRHLKVGHFIAACGDKVELVYVLPAGVPENVGCKVAQGELMPEYVRDKYLVPKSEEDDLMWKEKWEETQEEIKKLRRKKEELEKLHKTIMQLKDDKARLEKEVEKQAKSFVEVKKKAEAFKNLQKALAPLLPTAGFAPATPKIDVSMIVAEVDERINQRLSEAKEVTVVQIDVDQRIKELVKNSYVENLVAKIRGLPAPAVKAALWLHEKKSAKIGDLYYYMYEKTGRIPGNFYVNVVKPLENAWLIINEAGNVRWSLEEKLSNELKNVLRSGDVQDIAKYLTSLLL